MWRTNLAVGLTVLGTLAAYTLVANLIPQVESEVPTELVLASDVSAEELVAAGEEVYQGAGGCIACHGLGTRAPDLLGVAGSLCETRRQGMGCKAYLYESMVDPGAYVVDGFNPIMPDMRRTLSGAQIWAVIAFLQSQGGEVTVSAEDLAAVETGGETGEPAAGAAPVAAGSLDPRELVSAAGCIACHRLDGEGGPLGPPFDGMGALGEEYLRRAILNPSADTARGYEAVAGTMPATFGEQLTAAQMEALVRFLSER